MARRTFFKFTDREIKSLTKAGQYADGGGLQIDVKASGRKSWVFMTKIDGKRHKVGLGAYPEVALIDAREKAQETKKKLQDPKVQEKLAMGLSLSQSIMDESRATKVKIETFGSFTQSWLDDNLEQFSNPKHRQQWQNTLTNYCVSMWDKPIAAIGLEDVLTCIQPIWLSKNETAGRVRGRIERILSAAKVRGLRKGENPAAWRDNLSLLLPKVKREVKHHASMPYVDVPAFMERLSETDSKSSLCMRLIILSVVRSEEARGARWEEFDIKKRVWTLPASRMKARREHRVPITSAMLSILETLQVFQEDEFVFSSRTQTGYLTEAALRKIMKLRGAEQYTIHGFRSSFRNWVTEKTKYEWDVAEDALAHNVGSEVSRAYRRTDALEKRRAMMEKWASNFLVISDQL